MLLIFVTIIICFHIQGAEAKYGIILKKVFLIWLVQFLKKKQKRDKSKFSWLILLFKLFLKLKFSPKWVSKKNDKEFKICLTPKRNQKKKKKKILNNWSFFVASIKPRS